MRSRKWFSGLLAAALCGALALPVGAEPAAADGYRGLPQFAQPAADDLLAVVRTNRGTIAVRLYPEQAPKAVENFTALADAGYYDGLTFHRAVEGFVIQGGDPAGDGTGGRSIYAAGEGDPGHFEDEFDLSLRNFRGALCMANAGTDTNGSQFYIVQGGEIPDTLFEEMREYPAIFPDPVIRGYKAVGGMPHLDFRHTVFGMVVAGMDVVDAIAAVETDEADKPLDPVVIRSIRSHNGVFNPETGR